MQASPAAVDQENLVKRPHPATPIPTDAPSYQTPLGALYQGECVAWLRKLPSESINTVFADPPFNLKKDYGRGERLREFLALPHTVAVGSGINAVGLAARLQYDRECHAQHRTDDCADEKVNALLRMRAVRMTSPSVGD